MVTKEQALTAMEFHYTGNHECTKRVGPRGGIFYSIQQVRRSGVTQIWKRSPERFRVPVKYGMYESFEITEKNADMFHTADDCPLHKECVKSDH